MLQWTKALSYAVALFTAQLLIGFFHGLLLTSDTVDRLNIQLAASSLISFAACAAIFTHLAVHQSERTMEHALLALLLQFVLAAAFTILTLKWLGTPDLTTLGLELLVLFAALAMGTALGRKMRKERLVS